LQNLCKSQAADFAAMFIKKLTVRVGWTETSPRKISDVQSCSMNTTRIAELLEPFLRGDCRAGLDGPQLEKVAEYMDLLLRWNARMNLTAVRESEAIVTRHFGESSILARALASPVCS
jgi:hypothetical protein